MSRPHTASRRALLTGAAALAATTVTGARAAQAETLPADLRWQLVEELSDEFDSFDPDKWTNGVGYDTTGDLAFNPANVTVSDGNLVLTAKREEYNGKQYTCGAVESKLDIPGAPSYVEVSAKVLDSNANVLSAIWMQNFPLSAQNNPNPEIDIQETFDYSELDSHLHRWIIEPDDSKTHIDDEGNAYDTGVPDISTDYHLYGLERRDGRLLFYFDGRLALDIVPPDPSYVDMPRHLILSLEGHLGRPNDDHLPASFLIDYVRTYRGTSR